MYIYEMNDLMFNIFIKSFKSPTSYFTSVIMWASTTQLLDHLHHTNCHTLDLTINQIAPIIFILVDYPTCGILSHRLISPLSTCTRKNIITEFLWNYFIANVDAISSCTFLRNTSPSHLHSYISLFRVIYYLIIMYLDNN